MRNTASYVLFVECTHAGSQVNLSEEGKGKLSCPYCKYLNGEWMPLHTFYGETYDMKLAERKIYKDGHWNTICFPFSLSAEEIAKLPHVFKYNSWADYQLRTLEDSQFDESTGTLTLTFAPATDIEAGKPYIIRWSKIDEWRETNVYNIYYQLFRGVTMQQNEEGLNTIVHTPYASLTPVSKAPIIKDFKSLTEPGGSPPSAFPRASGQRIARFPSQESRDILQAARA